MRNPLGIARILKLASSQFHSRCLSTNPNLSKSHYDTLNIPSSASKKEIRDAYIKKSKLCHPDHDPSDPTLHAKFLAVQEAYDVLSTDSKRTEYDLGVANFHHHPRSSAHYQNQQAPGWGHQHQQQPFGRDDSFNDPKKPRAFWTEPEYQKMKPSVNKKTNVFGRELDAKAMNKLIVSGAFLWMIFGMAFVYIYVKYIYGRREVVLMDRQKKLSAQYHETRDEFYRAKSNGKVAELLETRMGMKTAADGKGD